MDERVKLAETLFKTLKLLESKTEAADKSATKKFDKAYNDLGKLMTQCEKSRVKIVKVFEGVEGETMANPEDFEAALHLVSSYKLDARLIEHEQASEKFTRTKIWQAEQTQGYIWEFNKWVQMLVRQAIAAPVTGMKYEPKENKTTKVDKLTKVIREKTGLGRGVSEQIADAIVRGREVERLALQKNWPIEDGVIEGPNGSVNLKDLG